jgi:hypothetical protein
MAHFQHFVTSSLINKNSSQGCQQTLTSTLAVKTVLRLPRHFRSVSHIRCSESLSCADFGKQFELRSVKSEFPPSLLLNLVLSMLTAIQALIILMSQNRQAEKDRVNAEHEYEVNLKAELESGASIYRPIPFCSVAHRITQLISGA